MYKKILHANDGSEGAFKALRAAIELSKITGAELHMVLVAEIDEFPETIGEVKAERTTAERRYRDVVQRAQKAAEARGVTLAKPHLLTGHTIRVITDLAGRLGADLLVVGASGHSGIFERLLGTKADRLVDLSPCSVLVVR
jgi:nucleotide-binding universal stress UspA family protein